MYWIECQCKFRNAWNEVEGLHPFANLFQAISTAQRIGTQRRTPTRIVDDAGRIVWQS